MEKLEEQEAEFFDCFDGIKNTIIIDTPICSKPLSYSINGIITTIEDSKLKTFDGTIDILDNIISNSGIKKIILTDNLGFEAIHIKKRIKERIREIKIQLVRMKRSLKTKKLYYEISNNPIVNCIKKIKREFI